MTQVSDRLLRLSESATLAMARMSRELKQDGVAQLSVKTLLSNEKDKLDALEKVKTFFE